MSMAFFYVVFLYERPFLCPWEMNGTICLTQV